jgi:hypothetical protein
MTNILSPGRHCRAGRFTPDVHGFSKGKAMISNCYDTYFRISAKEFFNMRLDWLWLKAQALAESGLDPEAVSPAGAVGIMQLMSDTAAEMARKHGIEGSPEIPHVNIRLGVAYDLRCFNVWAAEEEPGPSKLHAGRSVSNQCGGRTSFHFSNSHANAADL